MFEILYGIPILFSLVPVQTDATGKSLADSKMQKISFPGLAYGNYCIYYT
jgi:hypothetical protein